MCKAQSQPSNLTSTLIPFGRYKMNVFLSDYDEKTGIS